MKALVAVKFSYCSLSIYAMFYTRAPVARSAGTVQARRTTKNHAQGRILRSQNRQCIHVEMVLIPSCLLIFAVMHTT